MQQNIKIKAFFFLGVFSVLLMHHSIPHWHHQHQNQDNHSYTNLAHNHDFHRHQKNSDNHNTEKGFFDWLVEIHLHTTTNTSVLLMEKNTVKKISTQKELVKIFITNKVNPIHFEESLTKKRWYLSLNRYQDSTLLIFSQRGPPVIG
jgi:zinc transporter ZupT